MDDAAHAQSPAALDELRELHGPQCAYAKMLCAWLVSLDDPENVLGREERRSVTLTQIIERAGHVLALPPVVRNGEQVCDQCAANYGPDGTAEATAERAVEALEAHGAVLEALNVENARLYADLAAAQARSVEIEARARAVVEHFADFLGEEPLIATLAEALEGSGT